MINLKNIRRFRRYVVAYFLNPSMEDPRIDLGFPEQGEASLSQDKIQKELERFSAKATQFNKLKAKRNAYREKGLNDSILKTISEKSEKLFERANKSLLGFIDPPIAKLASKITTLSKKRKSYEENKEQKKKFIGENKTLKLRQAKEEFNNKKQGLETKLQTASSKIDQRTTALHSFAKEYDLDFDQIERKSYLRLAVFIVAFLLIAFSETAYNVQAFEIFRSSMIHNIISVASLSFLLPLMAHFAAGTIKKIERKFSIWKTILAVSLIGLPIVLSLIIGTIRASYLAEIGQDIEIANWVVLSYFNVFIFLGASFSSYFLHDEHDLRKIRQFKADLADLEKKKEKIEKDLEELCNEYSLTELSIEENTNKALQSVDQEVRDLITKEGELEELKHSSFNFRGRMIELLNAGCNQAIEAFIETYDSCSYREDEPQIALALNQFRSQRKEPSFYLKSIEEGQRLLKPLTLILCGLMILGTSCDIPPLEESLPAEVAQVVLIDRTGGVEEPPYKIEVDELKVLPSRGANLKIGLLDNTSDILIEDVYLEKQSWNNNRFSIEEKLNNFKTNASNILDSFYEKTSNNATRTSELWQPIAKVLKELSASTCKRKILIIASDMMENSSIINMYKVKNEDLLIKSFDKELNGVNLSGIEIHIVPPKSMNERNRKFARKLWKTYLTQKGAKIFWSANLTL